MDDPLAFSVDYDDEADEYYAIIDGERHGPLDEEDLMNAASSLHIHFCAFKYAPGYTPEDEDTDTSEIDPEGAMTDEEVEQELRELENAIEDEDD